MQKCSLARKYFDEKAYDEAYELFCELNMSYEQGLCKLLSDKLPEAYKIWSSVELPAIDIKWALVVYDLIRLKYNNLPSYFQVRAFLEVYLNLFIENKLFTYAENLISAQNILAKSNPEAYKFIARVLYSHGYFDILPDFIALSKQLCYLDPEIHFIEAQMFYGTGEYKKAIEALDDTLKIVPEYFPAHNLKKVILASY